jgi:hypothetical protein
VTDKIITVSARLDLRDGSRFVLLAIDDDTTRLTPDEGRVLAQALLDKADIVEEPVEGETTT